MHAPAAEQMALEPMTQFEPVNPAAPPPMLATAVSSKNTAAPVMAVSVAPAWSPTPAGARALHWQPCEILGGGTLSAPPLVVATARPRPLPVVLAQPVPARTRPLPPPPLPPPPELLAASPETCLQDVSQISPSPPKQPALLPTAAAAATPASGFAPPAAPPSAPAPVSPAPSQPGPALSTSTADILLSLSRAAPPAAPPATPVAGPRQAHANNGRVAGGAARAQARPKRQRTARGLGARRPPTAATLPSILPDAPPALPFSVPRAPDDELAAEAAGFRVKLSLTVCSGGVDGRPVGLVVADCGKCANCRDKRKFGGMGTKRQKCIAKKSTGEGPARCWAALRVVSAEHDGLIEMYANAPPPPLLSAAMAAGPLPLCWGFPRTKRARPLPPAFVVMYHSEQALGDKLDRSYLQWSLAQRACPSKAAATHPANDYDFYEQPLAEDGLACLVRAAAE